MHAIYLLDMLINKRLEEPYNKMPNDGPLPILSKTVIKSKLTKEFWNKTKHIYSSNGASNKNISFNNNDETNINIINKDKNLKKTKSGKNNINNNKNEFKLKNKRVKTPTINHANFRYMEDNKKNIFYYNNNSENNKIKYNNNIQILRDTAIRLEDELYKNKKIIEQQKEENTQLKNKIKKLTEMLKSIISMDKI